MKKKNFENLVESNEFENLSNYFLSTLRSPYKEYKYTIKNNDSIEKILTSFDILESEKNIIIR
ncbi:MAG: hypothetical protein ACJZ4O_03760 [Pelagibacteraceae bacterium]